MLTGVLPCLLPSPSCGGEAAPRLCSAPGWVPREHPVLKACSELGEQQPAQLCCIPERPQRDSRLWTV